MYLSVRNHWVASKVHRMTRPFRFAIQTGPFHDAQQLRTRAREIEALGYEELYSSDHIATASGPNCVDPFVALVIAAEATTTLRVGPLVLNNEFHQPALLARTAISVDQMTEGRLVLGMGTGYAQAEHDAIGVPLLPPGSRVTRFGESLHVLRELCDIGKCSFAGGHHQIDVPDFGIRPVQQHIPFLIGGHGRRVVSLAGRYADIFQFTGLTHADDGTPSGGGFAIEQIRERSRWLAEAAGDRNDAIERSALVQITAVGAEAHVETLATERLAQYTDVMDETPFILSGTLEQIIDKIERVREDLLISHFVVRDADGFAPVVDALAGC
ncbi:MAG: putative F420-dependent oxidoreductase [Paracrocinitomix sp.]|jgi:probable F420-dependent oxidoreductase